MQRGSKGDHILKTGLLLGIHHDYTGLGECHSAFQIQKVFRHLKLGSALVSLFGLKG